MYPVEDHKGKGYIIKISPELFFQIQTLQCEETFAKHMT